jgi:energy-coupling factor transporter ATP-binding protein EcfA2
MIFERVKNSILRNKEIKEAGGYIGLPCPFPRLSQYIPVIERGQSIGLLGSTGSGKSRLARYMFLYHPYKFYKDTGYPIRIFLLALEDNKEKVYRNLICHYLHDLYGIYITLQELDSKGDRILPQFIVDKITEAEAFFKEFEEVVTIVDGIHTPNAIGKYFESYALRTGKIESVNINIEGREVKQSRYIADYEVHTLIVIDNLSNIDVEETLPTEREAMTYFCKKIVRERLVNYFGFTVVQIMQQDFQSERQSFTKDGGTIVSKLEPSLAAIGESKVISRSMHLIFGLFNPSRFDLIQYPIPSKHRPGNTYRLDILGNRFRSLSVLKANDSDFGMKLAFTFDAVSEVMTELPKPETPEIEEIYNKIRGKNPEKFAKIKNVLEKPTGFKPLIEDDTDENPF